MYIGVHVEPIAEYFHNKRTCLYFYHFHPSRTLALSLSHSPTHPCRTNTSFAKIYSTVRVLRTLYVDYKSHKIIRRRWNRRECTRRFATRFRRSEEVIPES